MVWTDISCTTRTSLVPMDGNLNTDRYIFHFLRPVAVSYLQGLQNAFFHQGNAKRYIALCVVTFLDTLGFQFLPCPTRLPDLWPIENIWSWVSDSLALHPAPAIAVIEVWHRLVIAWSEGPFFCQSNPDHHHA
ncbi:transposable element Tcb1 transposase [Trichonephila clavipes]|nr:transposable element Tcb1 transposase [Trichonephila clavipes]